MLVPELKNEAMIKHKEGRNRLRTARARIGHAWRLLSDYWLSRHWKEAWLLLGAYAGLQILAVYVNLRINLWQRHFYDSIQARQEASFLPLILTFAIILIAEVGTILAQNWVSMMLAIRWRMHLTDRYLGRWFARDRFYEIERLRLIDNPDQRIAEDINSFTNTMGQSSLVVIAVGIVTSLGAAISFAAVMAPDTLPLSFSLFGYAISLPCDLVWFAVLYAIGGSLAVTWIGKFYVRFTMRQQHLEADFRSHLVHVRRNAPQISFMRAQERERKGLHNAFVRLKGNYQQLIFASMGLNFGTSAYQRIGVIVPLFLLVRRFFRGSISFGQVMAGQNAFMQLVSYLSYFIQAYGGIAVLLASLNRLKGLDDAIALNRPGDIAMDFGNTEEDVRVATKGLALRRPNGAPLVEVGDWTVRAGERWAVQGASGSGKSTLLRAIAGLWSDGVGKVFMTDRGSVMLVPQRLYLPPGTLKQAVCFPDDAEQHDDATIARLLSRVHLSAHVNAIHEVRMWHEDLSPGELQRVALARILLHSPDLVVLDEATSALDADNARRFHEALLENLPGATLISVVHDSKVLSFYTHSFRIDQGRGVASKLLPAEGEGVL